MKSSNKKEIAILANLDFLVAGIMLAILVSLTFMGVIWRYVLKSPFTWLEEVQMACMVWVVFAGAGGAFRTGNHVAIEMVVDLFPEKAQKFMNIVITVVVALVLGYLFWQSIGFVQMVTSSGRSTSILKIPYAFIYGIAVVSYINMFISYLYGLLKNVKSEAKEAIENE